MQEIYKNMQNDPFLFYFALIFALLWGGGAIWGIVLVFKSLGKKRRSFKVFKAMGFVKAKRDRLLLEKVKDACRHTVAAELFYHIKARIINMATDINVDKDSISIVDYNSGRELLLDGIICRRRGSEIDFYAGTVEKESSRGNSPFNRSSRSSVGWILCLSGSTGFDSTVIVYKRFSGYKKLLLGAALGMAGVKISSAEDAQSDFERSFEAVSRPHSGNPVSRLDAAAENLILKHEKDFPEGVKLYIGMYGIWMTGGEWLDAVVMESLYRMCEELLLRILH